MIIKVTDILYMLMDIKLGIKVENVNLGPIRYHPSLKTPGPVVSDLLS